MVTGRTYRPAEERGRGGREASGAGATRATVQTACQTLQKVLEQLYGTFSFNMPGTLQVSQREATSEPHVCVGRSTWLGDSETWWMCAGA